VSFSQVALELPGGSGCSLGPDRSRWTGCPSALCEFTDHFVTGELQIVLENPFFELCVANPGSTQL
jgi:hypothetical protein